MKLEITTSEKTALTRAIRQTLDSLPTETWAEKAVYFAARSALQRITGQLSAKGLRPAMMTLELHDDVEIATMESLALAYDPSTYRDELIASILTDGPEREELLRQVLEPEEKIEAAAMSLLEKIRTAQ